MLTLRGTDGRMPPLHTSSRHRLASVALAMSVLLSACQREGDDANTQANLPAGTPAESGPAAQQPTAADASVSSQIAAKRRALVAEAVSALQEPKPRWRRSRRQSQTMHLQPWNGQLASWTSSLPPIRTWRSRPSTFAQVCKMSSLLLKR